MLHDGRKPKPKPKTSVDPTNKCNGKRRDGSLCRRSAGFMTVHLGTGRCISHDKGAEKHVINGLYTNVQHARVRGILQELSEMEFNTMDLIPETNLLRAITIDYINRFDEFQEALLAWYEDPESNTRPRRIMDIADASHLIESISRVVQRMHQIQSEGAISLETFKRVTEHMGMIVAKFVKDPAVLNHIEAEWMNLALDAKPSPSTPVT